MRWTSGLLALLLTATASGGQPTWITMQNEYFRVYSEIGERSTRDALNQFERVRAFFGQFTGVAPGRAEPVYVVIFDSEKQYQPYRFNAAAAAYYSRRADRDVIVIGKFGEEASQTATHEYTHLVFEHAGFALPTWLNEGIADLFSTLKSQGTETVYGDVLEGHLREIAQEPWVPLATILAVGPNSAYYNEAQKAGAFYSESWALVHMLATTEQYRPKFWDIVRAIHGGTPSVQALESAYGVPLADLDRALRVYVRGDRFHLLRVQVTLEGAEKLPSRPADPFEVGEVLAELQMGVAGHEDEARTRLEALSREDASRPGPWTALGYLAWHQGDEVGAASDFAKAYAAGARSPRFLLDFGRVGAGSRPEPAAAALATLLEQQPKHLEARLALAELQLNLGRYAEALATALPIKAVRTNEQRDELLYLRAAGALQSGDLPGARANAAQLKKVSSAESYQTRADEILRFATPR